MLEKLLSYYHDCGEKGKVVHIYKNSLVTKSLGRSAEPSSLSLPRQPITENATCIWRATNKKYGPSSRHSLTEFQLQIFMEVHQNPQTTQWRPTAPRATYHIWHTGD